MKKSIIVAMDSFKGCIKSLDAGMAVREGIRQAGLDSDVIVLPMADGGEGTIEILNHYLGGEFKTCRTHDALMNEVEARFHMWPDGERAVVELAEAAGLTLIDQKHRSAVKATSFGFGELINCAIEAGARKIICTLGGSASNDAGLGAMQALGLRISANGRFLTKPVTGSDLPFIDDFDISHLSPNLSECSFSFLYDADIPFTGPHGATMMYSAQKGASLAEQKFLEAGMRNIASLLTAHFGIQPDSIPGAGAAGGTGAALAAFLKATPMKGIDTILDVASFDKLLENASLVITGEGKADAQTLQGKVAQGILRRASVRNVPVVLLAGAYEDKEILQDRGYASLIDINEGFDALIADPCNPEIAKSRIISAVKRYLRLSS